jgi:hypothetical protein
MPVGDIMPFISPLGGTYEIRYGSMTASQAWLQGHPVGVVNAGTVTQAPNDQSEYTLGDMDTVGNICGIAAWSVGTDDGDGTTTAGNINPKTGVAYATGDEVAFWPADQGILFITDNFHDNATTAAVVPAQTDVGEIYQISSSVTAAAGLGWGLEQVAGVVGTDVVAVVNDVLDTNYAPIRLTGGTGVYLVFEMKTK